MYGLILLNLQPDHASAGPVGVYGTESVPDAIEAYVRVRTSEYRRKYVVRDWHPSADDLAAGLDFSHFQAFPPHCAHDTFGAEHLAQVKALLSAQMVNGVYNKGQLGTGDGFSAFHAITHNQNYTLDSRLRYFGITQMDLVGLSEPSLRLTALHGVALGYPVRILEDLAAPLSPTTRTELARYDISILPSAEAFATPPEGAAAPTSPVSDNAGLASVAHRE